MAEIGTTDPQVPEKDELIRTGKDKEYEKQNRMYKTTDRISG